MIDQERINIIIKFCEDLLEMYDHNYDITDIDIAHIIEMLKGRE